MTIRLEKLQSEEYETLFSVVKQGLFEHIDAVFGWSDTFQRQRLQSVYKLDWFHWIYVDEQRIGMLCHKPYDKSIHVHFLIIFPEFQHQGLGQAVMNYVYDEALKEQLNAITLSSFRSNKTALHLYQKLGYQIIESDKDFLTLSLTLHSPK